MNPETLKYMIALQKKFREVMVDVRRGDMLCYAADRDPFFVEDWNSLEDIKSLREGLYIIPRTIDDYSDEARKRSLWGMVDWPKIWDSTSEHSKLKLMLDLMFGKTTPTLAILKALAEQWEVKV